MPDSKPIDLPEIIKLFDFLKSETIAEKKRVERYLSGKGIVLTPNLPTVQSIKMWLATFWLGNGTPPSTIKLFAKKMGDAWRVDKHRKNKNLVTLSVSLDRKVSNLLSEMCKGHKKKDIITRLITQNYKELLDNQKATKDKLAREIRLLEDQKNRADFEIIMLRAELKKQHTKQTSVQVDELKKQHTEQTSVQVDELKKQHTEQTSGQVDELKNGLAKLYEIIVSANAQSETIEDQKLIDALLSIQQIALEVTKSTFRLMLWSPK